MNRAGSVEQCIARLREIATDELFNCVTTPTRSIWRTLKWLRKFHLAFAKSAQPIAFGCPIK
jgi:hypothetical protein